MMKQEWIVYFLLIMSSTEALPMSCSYGQRGSLTSTCYNANPAYFRKTTYRFDNLDETVRCINCSLEIIDSGTFDISRNQIKFLDLESSNIAMLKSKSFLGLVYLRKLNLKNNFIMAVPVETFQGAIKIEDLDMEHNAITSLIPNGFKELTHLKKLNLRNNRIEKIENGSFDGLIALEELDLSNNYIINIANIFEGLLNVGLINLESNKIEKISPLDIKQTDTLLYLNLGKNMLKTVEKDSFLLLPRLETLNLSFNPISSIELNGFRGLDSLEQLDLSNCLIQKISIGLLTALHQLRILNLSFNRLSVFQTGVFSGLPELRKLNLSHNNINLYLKTGLFSLHNLHSIDLSFNNLADLDYKMLVHHLPALSFLSLGNNSLPCYLRKEIEVVFEQDNLVFDLGPDDEVKCNVSMSKDEVMPVEEAFFETSEASVQIDNSSNGNDYILYVLVTLSLSMIMILFYMQYRNKRMLNEIFGKSTISETRLISNALNETDSY